MTLPRILARLIAALLLALAALAAIPAQAEVQVRFYSITGSMTGTGRYPHTFVVFDGTLADGTRVNTNYGFSARYTSQVIGYGPAEHMIQTETARTVANSNRHFTVTVSDRQYRRLLAEVIAWRDYPGRYYDLDDRNCIHFVARLATLLGIRADVPREFLQNPREWLNFVGRQNPQLGAAQIS